VEVEVEVEVASKPFIHSVELKGKNGILNKIDGLFDDGAMVNSICKSAFSSLKDRLGATLPSSKTLRMADGAIVPSSGRWRGDVTLGGQTVEGSFEIFPSGGGWSVLFGKPLLQQFKAVHDYENDTLKIPVNGEWTTILNECQPAENVHTVTENGGKHRRGRRARRNKQKQREEDKQNPSRWRWWDAIWTVQDANGNDTVAAGDLQPEIDISSDRSIFT
jgi:hypothetical protein